MQLFKIIIHIILLYGLYICGTWIQQSLNLFIPGSIIGMILLFSLLMTKAIKPNWIKDGSQLLIKNMPLLFIPVTVGIINYLELFTGKGILLAIIILVSTTLVMVSAGHVSQRLLRKVDHHD